MTDLKFIEYIETSLGTIEIAASDTAVGRIHFMKEGEVQQKSSRNAIASEMAKQLKAYFEGDLQKFEIPFYQDGTPFQQSVWEQLLTIPYGETISYLELAHKINNPKSIRAVGTTNGKNQLAILVPCHRVIGSNGKLTGYASGLWRKRLLLDHEMKVAKKVLTLF